MVYWSTLLWFLTSSDFSYIFSFISWTSLSFCYSFFSFDITKIFNFALSLSKVSVRLLVFSSSRHFFDNYSCVRTSSSLNSFSLSTWAMWASWISCRMLSSSAFLFCWVSNLILLHPILKTLNSLILLMSLVV